MPGMLSILQALISSKVRYKLLFILPLCIGCDVLDLFPFCDSKHKCKLYLTLCLLFSSIVSRFIIKVFLKSLLNFRRDQPEGWEIVFERRNRGGRRGGRMEREEGDEEK